MAYPQISAIIAVYNGEAFLGEAIESVLRQTEAVHELIVVDDGSTDDSLAVAQSFGDRVTLLSVNHGGQARAQNIGVHASSGDYIAFLDADDRWTLDKTELQLAVFESDRSLHAVFGEVRQFSEPTVPPPTKEFLPGLVPGAMLLKKEAWEEIGGFNESLPVGGAMEWLTRARAWGLKSSSVETTVLQRRLHENNQGRLRPNPHAAYFDTLRAIQQLKKRLTRQAS